jgi:hypothetical protein
MQDWHSSCGFAALSKRDATLLTSGKALIETGRLWSQRGGVETYAYQHDPGQRRPLEVLDHEDSAERVDVHRAIDIKPDGVAWTALAASRDTW